jgi:hypothetical protein
MIEASANVCAWALTGICLAWVAYRIIRFVFFWKEPG